MTVLFHRMLLRISNAADSYRVKTPGNDRHLDWRSGRDSNYADNLSGSSGEQLYLRVACPARSPQGLAI
jgi:hypothetical protein